MQTCVLISRCHFFFGHVEDVDRGLTTSDVMCENARWWQSAGTLHHTLHELAVVGRRNGPAARPKTEKTFIRAHGLIDQRGHRLPTPVLHITNSGISMNETKSFYSSRTAYQRVMSLTRHRARQRASHTSFRFLWPCPAPLDAFYINSGSQMFARLQLGVSVST